MSIINDSLKMSIRNWSKWFPLSRKSVFTGQNKGFVVKINSNEAEKKL